VAGVDILSDVHENRKSCLVAGHASAGHAWTETLAVVCESDTDAGCGVKA
jgi:hypothetical protein